MSGGQIFPHTLRGPSRAAVGQELVAVGFGNPVEPPYEEDKKEPVR